MTRVPELDRSEPVTEADMAAMREAQFIGAAVAKAQALANVRQSTPGTCSNCGDPTPGGRVYCDDDCRADHEARQRRKVRA
jgi:hypothetical protein